MKEINNQCSVLNCPFQKNGECLFLLETQKKAEEFQGAKDVNSSSQMSDAAWRWSRIKHDIYDRFEKADCLRKNEVGDKIEKIIPKNLKKQI